MSRPSKTGRLVRIAATAGVLAVVGLSASPLLGADQSVSWSAPGLQSRPLTQSVSWS